jgi:quercetin dioxygenase-like cupin family protein
MSFPPRRVVTGHDQHGRAIVTSDRVVDNGVIRRPGHRSFVLWTTEKVPVEHDSAPDSADLGTIDRTLPTGTVFRVVEYAPGVTPARHQTDSIDYAIVISGEIDLVLDDEIVHLHAGDTLIQRATAHDWINHCEAPCVIAFCLIGAVPQVNGAVQPSDDQLVETTVPPQ